VKAFELGVDRVVTFTVDPWCMFTAGLTSLRLITRTSPVTSPSGIIET